MKGIVLDDLLDLPAGDVIATYSTSSSAWAASACIVPGGLGQEPFSLDMPGCLEHTLHAILDAGGDEEDVLFAMGLEKDGAEGGAVPATYVDLGYALPGEMLSFALEEPRAFAERMMGDFCARAQWDERADEPVLLEDWRGFSAGDEVAVDVMGWYWGAKSLPPSADVAMPAPRSSHATVAETGRGACPPAADKSLRTLGKECVEASRELAGGPGGGHGGGPGGGPGGREQG